MNHLSVDLIRHWIDFILNRMKCSGFAVHFSSSDTPPPLSIFHFDPFRVSLAECMFITAKNNTFHFNIQAAARLSIWCLLLFYVLNKFTVEHHDAADWTEICTCTWRILATSPEDNNVHNLHNITCTSIYRELAHDGESTYNGTTNQMLIFPA